MKKRNCLWISLSVFFCLMLTAAFAAPVVNETPEKALVSQLSQKAYIPFIENKGQIKDTSIRFYLRGNSGLVLYREKGEIEYYAWNNGGKAAFSEKFMGVCTPEMKGGKASATRVSFFYGKNPESWKPGLSTYHDIVIENLYRDISVQFKAKGSSIEDIYTLGDPADTEKIQVLVDGAKRISTDAYGNLVIETSAGRFLKTKPVAYQTIGGNRKQVVCRYTVTGMTYGFKAESVYEEYKDYMEYYGYQILDIVERPVALGAGPALG